MFEKLKRYLVEIILLIVWIYFMVDIYWPEYRLADRSPTTPALLDNHDDADKTRQVTTHPVQQQEPQDINVEPEPVITLGRNGDKKHILSAIKVTRHSSPFNFEVYRLQKPLLPKARLLDIIKLNGSLWFSSDSGLIEFNPNSRQWWLRDRETGLPGDSAYNIGLQQERLLLDIKNWKNNGKYDYLSNVGNYWLIPGNKGYTKTKTRINETLTGQQLTTDNSDIIHHNISDAIYFNNRLWITSHGSYNRNSKQFEGGGVTRLDPATREGTQYSEKDGLASPYCHTLTASSDGRIWVVHFKEKLGISVFDPETGQWQVKLTSKNGLELGGVELAATGKYILIGQQRGFLIYNTENQQAFMLNEKLGLPGYIVTDVVVDGNIIWVSAYGYASGGKGSDRGGLVKIPLSELDRISWQ